MKNFMNQMRQMRKNHSEEAQDAISNLDQLEGGIEPDYEGRGKADAADQLDDVETDDLAPDADDTWGEAQETPAGGDKEGCGLKEVCFGEGHDETAPEVGQDDDYQPCDGWDEICFGELPEDAAPQPHQSASNDCAAAVCAPPPPEYSDEPPRIEAPSALPTADVGDTNADRVDSLMADANNNYGAQPVANELLGEPLALDGTRTAETVERKSNETARDKTLETIHRAGDRVSRQTGQNLRTQTRVMESADDTLSESFDCFDAASCSSSELDGSFQRVSDSFVPGVAEGRAFRRRIEVYGRKFEKVWERAEHWF